MFRGNGVVSWLFFLGSLVVWISKTADAVHREKGETKEYEVGLLNNPRQEHFAQLVATGQTPAQAYAAAGYEEKTAYTCGPRLLKRPEVRSRVTELQQTAAQTSVSRAALSRDFVVRELMDNALKAKENHEWPASNRALELLGRELY